MPLAPILALILAALALLAPVLATGSDGQSVSAAFAGDRDDGGQRDEPGWFGGGDSDNDQDDRNSFDDDQDRDGDADDLEQNDNDGDDGDTQGREKGERQT